MASNNGGSLDVELVTVQTEVTVAAAVPSTEKKKTAEFEDKEPTNRQGSAESQAGRSRSLDPSKKRSYKSADDPIVIPEASRSRILSLIFFGLVALITGGVWYVWYYEANLTLHALTTRLVSQVRYRTDAQLHSFADLPVIGADLIQALYTEGEIDPADINGMTNKLDPLFRDQLLNFNFTNIYIGLQSGGFILAGMNTSTQMLVGYRSSSSPVYHKALIDANGYRIPSTEFLSSSNYNTTARSWYVGATKNMSKGWTDLYPFASGDLGVSYFQPLYDLGADYRSKTFVGVIAVDISLAAISPLLEVLGLTEHGVTFVMLANPDPTQPFRLVASSNWEEEKAHKGTASLALVQSAYNEYIRAAGQLYLDMGLQYGDIVTATATTPGDKQDYVVTFAPLVRSIPGLNFIIVTVVPAEDFLSSVSIADSASIFYAFVAGAASLTLVACFITIAPQVAKARTYRWRAFERARLQGTLPEESDGYIPPVEQDPYLERYRRLAFVDPDHPVQINRESLRNCDWFLWRLRLTTHGALFGLLIFVCALVVIALAAIWLTWKLLTNYQVDTISAVLLKQTGEYSFDQTLGLLNIPQKINHFMAQKFDRGALNVTAAGAYDRFLFDTMNAWKLVGGGPFDWYAVMIYWATPAGWLQGIQQAITFSTDGFTVANSQLRIAGRDSTTMGPSQCVYPAVATTSFPCYRKWPLADNKVRNISNTANPIYSVDCTYSPLTRSWYTSAVANTKPLWGAPYTFTGTTSLGVTASWPAYDKSGNPAVVFAVDVELQVLSNFLSQIVADVLVNPGSSDSTNDVVVVTLNDPSLLVVGSSDMEVSQPVDGVLVRLPLVDSTNPLNGGVKQEVANFMENYLFSPDSPTSIDGQGVVQMTRLVTDPATAIGVISDPYGLNYLSITLWDATGTTAVLTNYQTLSLLLTCFSMVVTLLIIGYSFNALLLEVAVGDVKERPIDHLGDEEASIEALADCRDEIADLVKRAAQKMCEDPDPEVALQKKLETGSFFVVSTQRDRNVLLVCVLVLQDHYRWYRLKTHGWFRNFVTLCVVIQVFIGIARPSFQDFQAGATMPKWVMALDWLFLMVELFDISLTLLISYRWIPECPYGSNTMIGASLRDTTNVPVDLAVTLIWVLAFLDWIMCAATSISFEYYFPLRVFFLILLNPKVYLTLRTFIITMGRALHVFTLFFVLLIIYTTIGFPLFSGTLNPGDFGYSFTDYLDGLLTVCIFIFSGDDYSDTVYPTISSGSDITVLFWLFLTVSCLWFLIAMVLAIFAREYGKERENVMVRQRLRNRIGLCASFVLIDEDGSGNLDQDEFLKFVAVLDVNQRKPGWIGQAFNWVLEKFGTVEEAKVIRGVKGVGQADIDAVKDSDFFDRINSDGNTDVDIKEFVEGIENSFALLRLKHTPRMIRGINMEEFVQDPRFETLRLVTCIINIFFVSLYGLKVGNLPPHAMDQACFIMLIIFLVDQIFLMWVYRPGPFFNYGRYEPDIDFIGFTNCVEFFVLIFSWAVYIGLVAKNEGSTSGAQGCCDFTQNATFRVAFALPSIRLLVLVKSCRQLVKTLLTVLVNFVPLILLLYFFLHFFAVYGCLMFNGGWDLLDPDNQPNGQFTGLWSGYLAMFEVMIGNNWSSTMYSAMQVYGQYKLWFFVVFFALVSILYSQLFLGNLLSAFEIFLDSKEEAEKTAHEQKKMGYTQKAINTDIALAFDAAVRKIA